jgi:cobalt/nickel transport system permease protein
MHIPDGYLSPQTYLPLYGVFIGFTAITLKKVKKELNTKTVPFLGMAAAFSFLIMMFNIPIPGGTTGHAVGAAIIAILLGPWIASISVCIALIIQALVFADGGITSLGANCFNMGIVMPFVAYFVFKILSGKSENPNRKIISAFFAGYLSLCIASVITAVEFGIQPLIAVGVDGNPLYSPYPLKVALPAMAFEHFLLFGFIEGLVTSLIYKYFLKNDWLDLGNKNEKWKKR